MKIKSDKLPGLTPRVLLVTLLIAPINCYFVIQMELVRHVEISCMVPLSNVIFILTIIVVLNYLIRKAVPSLALRQDELLMFYVMLSFITTLCAYDILQAVLSVLGHGFWFATLENEYKELFWEYIPRWLTVSDRRALQGYYMGNSSFYTARNLRLWIPVALAWLLFFMVIAFILLCLTIILRRQWAQQERLAFPIIQLPLAMTNPLSGFFRNKQMWIGLSIAAGISLFSGLHALYPSVPHIPVKRRFFAFNERPFSFYDGASVAFYPAAIGVMFLMPLDILFSTAFFYGLYRNQLALAEAMNWRSLPGFTNLPDAQAFGAFLGLCFFLIWVGKRHFRNVFKQTFSRKAKLDDAEGLLSYRAAIVGLLLGLVFFAFLLNRAGMSLWLASTFAVLFLVTPIVTTRVRAEGGIPVHAFHWQAPRYVLINALGSRRLGRQNLTSLSMCFFNRDYRTQQMPHQLEAFKISEQVSINKRRALIAILIATAVGVIGAFWTQLHFYYRYGSASGYFRLSLGYGQEYFGRLRNWIDYPTGTNWPAVLFMGIGFSVMMLLTYLRIRFFWLPLHPLGYVMANNQEMIDLWGPVLICLMVKWLILKHGGIRSYRRTVPFFLGLILGDYLMGCIWGIVSMALNVRTYEFYP